MSAATATRPAPPVRLDPAQRRAWDALMAAGARCDDAYAAADLPAIADAEEEFRARFAEFRRATPRFDWEG